MFVTVTVLVLRSVKPPVAAKVLKKRERYELEVESKRSEIPSLNPVPYTASINRSLLNNLVFMAALQEIAPDNAVDSFTDDDVKSLIVSFVQGNQDEVSPCQLRESMKGLRLAVHIVVATAQVTRSCSDF